MKRETSFCSPYLCYQAADTEHQEENFCGSNMSKINQNEQHITMLVYKMECFKKFYHTFTSQMYVWHSCKWKFARPEIQVQPAKIISQ